MADTQKDLNINIEGSTNKTNLIVDSSNSVITK